MNSHRRVGLLFVGCMAYLFLGAVIFSAIEGHHEETTRANLNNSISDFLEEHPSVSFEELMDLLHSIKQAGDQGVTPEVISTRNNMSDEWVRLAKPAQRNWDLPNAFFFSTTVVTTIGYGNLSPSTNLGRHICVLYAFIGIPFVGWLLAEFGIQCRKRGQFIAEKMHSDIFCFVSGDKLRKYLTRVVMMAFVYGIIVVVPAIVYSYIEGWDFPTAHYYCFITVSTIGFGDFVATDRNLRSNTVRWLYKITTAMYFMFGLACLAIVFNAMQQKQQNNVKKIKAAFTRKTDGGEDTNNSAQYEPVPGEVPGGTERSGGDDSEENMIPLSKEMKDASMDGTQLQESSL